MTEDNKNQPQKPADQSSNNENANVEYLKPVERPMPPPKQEPIPKGYGRDVIESELCIWFGGGMQPRLMSDDEAKLVNRFPYFGFKNNPDEKIQYLKVDIDRGLCEFVSREEMVKALIGLWSNFDDLTKATRVYRRGIKHTESMVSALMSYREFFGETKPTGYLKKPDDFTFCFHRYDFEPIRNHPKPREAAPIFFSFIDRMENARALCQVIGASLAGEPIRKMAPLIFGEPGCGKSMFLEILKIIFGPGWVDFTANWQSNYATADLENKTGWGYDEVDAKFINSDHFKRITGSKTIGMQRPYVGHYQGELCGNFYMTCNEDRLQVFNNSAIVSERLIACRIRGVIPHDERISATEMIRRIQSELAAIHGYCLDVFAALGNHVDKDMASIMKVVEETEADLKEIFDHYFIFDESAITELSGSDFLLEWNNAIRLTHPTFVNSKHSLTKFRRYIKSVLKRNEFAISIRKDGIKGRYISGVRLKPKPPSMSNPKPWNSDWSGTERGTF